MSNTEDALRANIRRYYDLCVVVRLAKEEMKLLDQQFDDLLKNLDHLDKIDWVLEDRESKIIRQWEAENPQWTVRGDSIRAKKQNNHAIT